MTAEEATRRVLLVVNPRSDEARSVLATVVRRLAAADVEVVLAEEDRDHLAAYGDTGLDPGHRGGRVRRERRRTAPTSSWCWAATARCSGGDWPFDKLLARLRKPVVPDSCPPWSASSRQSRRATAIAGGPSKSVARGTRNTRLLPPSPEETPKLAFTC